MKTDLKIKTKKIVVLKAILKKLKSAVVAYSGGVDSTFLLYAAMSVLGRDNVIAVTATSESYPAFELNSAKRIARHLRVKHVITRTNELKNKDFSKNPVNRCYFCKKELFRRLKKIARENGCRYVLDGSTADDLNDLRFGTVAAKEEGIKSPMQQARLCKQDIRGFAKRLGLRNWNKPSFACLASRFEYNKRIDKDKLRIVEEAEDFMRRAGFGQLRVRCHGDIARIEIDKTKMRKFFNNGTREKIAKKLKSLGFTYVTVDLAGYRTGSMNEGLDITPSS